MPAPIADLVGAYPRGSALAIAGLLATAVVWHLSLPPFFYRSTGVYIDGPLPAVLGVAVALWVWRKATPLEQAIAACAWAFLTLLASVLVFGTWVAGPLRAIPALWGEVRQGFRLPFSAVVDSWGSAYAGYSFWPALRPLMLWGTLIFVVLLLRRPGGPGSRRVGGLVGGMKDRWAFNAAQRRQMNTYRATYLAALRDGEVPPPPPPSLLPSGGGASGLVTTHLVLRIGLAVAGALGIAGGVWSLLGDALKGPVVAIFWRGLTGG